MTEADAEWYTPDVRGERPRPRTPIDIPDMYPAVPRFHPRGMGPNSPRRPTIRPPNRRRHHDEADTAAPSTLSAGAVASISVITSLLVVAGILALLYFTLLRKKYTKKNTPGKNDFSIRIEDVAHMSIDDSSNTYANTEDLKRLVSSIRQKHKEPICYANKAFQQTSQSPIKLSHKVAPSVPSYDEEKDKIADDGGRINEKEVYPSRCAPPPPIPKHKPDGLQKSRISLDRSTAVEIRGPMTEGLFSCAVGKLTRLPPILPKPKITEKQDEHYIKLENMHNLNEKVPIKPTYLPNDAMNSNKKRCLPLLNTNISTLPHNPGETSSTPETAETIVNEPEVEPEKLTLKQKRALWENAATNR